MRADDDALTAVAVHGLEDQLVETVEHLLAVLQKLVDRGNTVVVIEHNMDVIKVADVILDLGPEGGRGGGEIVAYGTPEQVCKVEKSLTGQFLRKELGL